MPSSLFSQKNPMNNMLNTLSQLKQMMNGQNPQAVYNSLMQNNPQFAKFVRDNQGKSLQQIAQENGIDFNQLRNFLG